MQALHAFRAAGKRLLFVTNNSSKSRQEYRQKFQSLGIDVAAQEVSRLNRQAKEALSNLPVWTAVLQLRWTW